ncbi:hypothetical protein JCM3775_002730 [Rhodotorula graminis]
MPPIVAGSAPPDKIRNLASILPKLALGDDVPTHLRPLKTLATPALIAKEVSLPGGQAASPILLLRGVVGVKASQDHPEIGRLAHTLDKTLTSIYALPLHERSLKNDEIVFLQKAFHECIKANLFKFDDLKGMMSKYAVAAHEHAVLDAHKDLRHAIKKEDKKEEKHRDQEHAVAQHVRALGAVEPEIEPIVYTKAEQMAGAVLSLLNVYLRRKRYAPYYSAILPAQSVNDIGKYDGKRASYVIKPGHEKDVLATLKEITAANGMGSLTKVLLVEIVSSIGRTKEQVTAAAAAKKKLSPLDKLARDYIEAAAGHVSKVLHVKLLSVQSAPLLYNYHKGMIKKAFADANGETLKRRKKEGAGEPFSTAEFAAIVKGLETLTKSSQEEQEGARASTLAAAVNVVSKYERSAFQCLMYTYRHASTLAVALVKLGLKDSHILAVFPPHRADMVKEAIKSHKEKSKGKQRAIDPADKALEKNDDLDELMLAGIVKVEDINDSDLIDAVVWETTVKDEEEQREQGSGQKANKSGGSASTSTSTASTKAKPVNSTPVSASSLQTKTAHASQSTVSSVPKGLKRKPDESAASGNVTSQREGSPVPKKAKVDKAKVDNDKKPHKKQADIASLLMGMRPISKIKKHSSTLSNLPVREGSLFAAETSAWIKKPFTLDHSDFTKGYNSRRLRASAQHKYDLVNGRYVLKPSFSSGAEADDYDHGDASMDDDCVVVEDDDCIVVERATGGRVEQGGQSGKDATEG